MSNQYGSIPEIVKKILAVLPGTNCGGHGGCGKASCEECAVAIAESKDVTLCPACSQGQADEIAEITGSPAKEIYKKVAFIACAGHAAGKERFAGLAGCAEAKEKGFIRGECKDGCLGLGSCVEFCTFGAMKAVDGSIIIDKEKCNGCGACASAESCVQGLIHMIPADATNFIPCSSCEEDDDKVREICGFGCIACGECERACPEGAVSVVNNHAVIDYDKCVGCIACAVKCRKKIIVDTLHDLSELKEKVAFVACSGGGRAGVTYGDMGLASCKEAVAKADPKELGLCTTGCTGLGDCTRVCRYDAIHIVNGTALVDTDKCVGCKDCTYACPKGLITIVPYKGAKMVPCSSTDDYEDKLEVCGFACVGCGDCAANCPNGAIYMKGKHAVVDPEICEDCNVCQYVCQRNVIRERKVPEHNYIQTEALKFRKGE
ncbi:MAG: 4Fe-4S binding protein [Firmicutes bacterium]|nr:4Fe-4S binding protein [Bacillota bacterium]